MRKILIYILAILIGAYVLLSIGNTFAQGCNFSDSNVGAAFQNGCQPDGVIEASGDYDLTKKDATQKIIGDILERIQIVGGILGMLMIVVSGIMFVLPAKQETKTTGKKMLTYSVVGFLFVVIAPFLVNIVVNFMYDLLG